MSSSRARLNIHLNKIKENIQLLKCASNSNIIAMIKANAYGHGLIEIYQYLKDHCEVNFFGVASIEEAMLIRRLTKDYSSSIIVFSDLAFNQGESFNHFVNEKIIPVISSWEDLDLYLERNKNSSVPLYLKVNTGMNRLGVRYKDSNDFLNELNKRNIKKIDHLMTHFSSSNLKIDQKSKCFKQYENFKEIKSKLNISGIEVCDSSVSNSGAIEQGVGFEESFIRPGILLYGASVLDPTLRKEAVVKTKLVSSMETSVIDCFDVKKGTEIGYGNYEVTHDGRIVLVGIGYGDGLPTQFTGASVSSQNKKGTVVGKINMDLTAILFSEKISLNKGNKVQIWGEGYSQLSEISDEVGLIAYEILCNIGQRISRSYTL